MSDFNYNDIVGKVFTNKKGLKYIVENFVEKKNVFVMACIHV